jgi:hypothetical protein
MDPSATTSPGGLWEAAYGEWNWQTNYGLSNSRDRLGGGLSGRRFPNERVRHEGQRDRRLPLRDGA